MSRRGETDAEFVRARAICSLIAHLLSQVPLVRLAVHEGSRAVRASRWASCQGAVVQFELHRLIGQTPSDKVAAAMASGCAATPASGARTAADG